jgi:negative regulator of replication initiation
MMIEEIKLLLDLFESKAPDTRSNRQVWKCCDQRHQWTKAHSLFTSIRQKNLAAHDHNDMRREVQYSFEEVVAKSLFNMTGPSAPFDPDTPYWVIKNALSLAKALKIPSAQVLEIVA